MQDMSGLKELATRLRKHLSKEQVDGVMGDNWLEFLDRSLPLPRERERVGERAGEARP